MCISILGVVFRWVMYLLGMKVVSVRLISVKVQIMGSSSQLRLREVIMVIIVQIIKLINELTFSRLRFCSLLSSGRMRVFRAIAWQISVMIVEIIVMRRQSSFFCSRSGIISVRLTEQAISASRVKTGIVMSIV